jgi:hypothetical protein
MTTDDFHWMEFFLGGVIAYGLPALFDMFMRGLRGTHKCDCGHEHPMPKDPL